MDIEYLSPDVLIPYAANAKKHPPEQVEYIANSLREFGFRQPIVVDAKNVVVIGHGRLLAAKHLRAQGVPGFETVPVLRADDLTEAQIKALRLADNKTNESDWDLLSLEAELSELELVFDMSDFGFDSADARAEDSATDIVEDDFDDGEPVEPRAVPGDIYQLGEHRLMCGDSTDPDAVAKLVDGATIDLLLTDPPYNCDVGSCERPYSKNNGVHIVNDNMPESDFIRFLASAFHNADQCMRPGGAYYIWYAGLHHIEFERAIRRVESFRIHEQLIWVKSHFVLGILITNGCMNVAYMAGNPGRRIILPTAARKAPL